MKLILDLDTGIDDAFALAYALASPEVELLGVTGTYGNVTVEQGVRNTLALLQLFGRSDVPVYAGPQPEGWAVSEVSAFIHGSNGVGDVELAAAGEPVGDAVAFLLDAVRTHEDLVIVPTGASTSIAAALEDEYFAEHARIVIMGGALTVPGNVRPWAEANVFQDPEATNEVFRRLRHVTMIGLDVTLKTLLTSSDAEAWRGTAVGDVLADLAEYYINAYRTTSPHLGGCGLHDPLAVAVAVDPSLVECLELPMQVDVAGETRGRTIGRMTGNPVRVAVDVDVDKFLSGFLTRLTRLTQDT